MQDSTSTASTTTATRRAEEAVLTVSRLRDLARSSRSGGLQTRIEQTMLHRVPETSATGLDEMAALLREIIDGWLRRMRDAGIEPPEELPQEPSRLTTRERRNVLCIAALLTHEAVVTAEGAGLAVARDRAHEAMRWAALADDRRQMAIVWQVLASIASVDGDYDEEERCLREAVACARADGRPVVVATSLEALCAMLVARQRLDEAEELSEETMALTRGWPADDEHRKVHASVLLNRARIVMYRTRYSEGITLLRSALEWVDGDLDPSGRAALLTHLGSVYLRLQQYRQSIECQHEVVQLGATIDSPVIRGWGYFRLAEAHIALDELDVAEESLNRAADNAPESNVHLHLSIGVKRAQVYNRTNRPELALRTCAQILRETNGLPVPDLIMATAVTMAESEVQRGDLAGAESHMRMALDVARAEFPQRAPQAAVRLADLLVRRGHDDDALELLDELGLPEVLNPSERVSSLRVRGTIAERRGELGEALRVEREAAAIERALLESRAEQNLNHARMVAEIDLLEREADLERERRQRLERELASAVVELSDRRRRVERVEDRLHSALERDVSSRDQTPTGFLREMLAELRAQNDEPAATERYVGSADDGFYRALRERSPDLTRKQERLCALIGAGHSSKEIETFMGIGAEGLKAQRKRLRKKLGLEQGESLEKMLAVMMPGR